MKKPDIDQAIKLIEEVRDRLDAWSDTANIRYRQTNDLRQANLRNNYNALFEKLGLAVAVLNEP